jgi:hypothetical protein
VTKDPVQMRKFVDNYYKDTDISKLYINPTQEKKILVLDGQQRLQALYLALFGKYEDSELYIDILSGDAVDENDIKYRFEFLRRNIPKKESVVLLKEIVLSDEKSTQISRAIIQDISKRRPLSEQERILIEDNVSQIKKLFSELDLVNYYNIDSTEGGITDYEEILEIFVRVNSGGTILSKSDLMFSLMKLSWEEAEEKFDELLKKINQNGAFQFDKDFILKTALTLIGSGAKYEVSKFKGEKGTKNLEAIESNWPQIESSIRWTIDYVNDYAYIKGDKALPSYNVLVPIIYFVYVKNKRIEENDKHNMFVWMYSSLLNRSFSGQSDNVIDSVIDLLKSSNAHFPSEEMNKRIREKNRRTEITEDVLDSDKFVILNIIYLKRGGVYFSPLYSGNVPSIDHIFSQSKLRKEFALKKDSIDDIGNLRFLSRDENILKSDSDVNRYFTDDANRKLALEVHLIPNNTSLWNISNYKEFIAERRKMIMGVIESTLFYVPS